MSARSIRCLSSTNASSLDHELFTTFAFSLYQLMELAGLAVAQAVYSAYPPSSSPTTTSAPASRSPSSQTFTAKNKIVIVCGPGNNGGDGLVAARHLRHFGYRPVVCYPKSGKTDVFPSLVVQLQTLAVPFIQPDQLAQQMADADAVVDAVFGFGFNSSGTVREPFRSIISTIAHSPVPVISVDIPSGWDVNHGPIKETTTMTNNNNATTTTISPSVLISLTAPKPFISHFRSGRHYLGGRFLPSSLAARYGLTDLPAYPGFDQIVELPVPLEGDVAPDPGPEHVL